MDTVLRSRSVQEKSQQWSSSHNATVMKQMAFRICEDSLEVYKVWSVQAK